MKSNGVGFFGLLGITFIILKLTKVIEWSWLWVLAPLWGPSIVGIILLILFLWSEARNKSKLNDSIKNIRR